MFLVPADTADLSLGKSTDLLDWRTAAQVEIHLDNVRVPADQSRVGLSTQETQE